MFKSRKNHEKKDGPSHRIFNPRKTRTPRYRARRTIILGIVVVTALFIGKIILSFFNFERVSFALFGNMHYTEGQIYDVLGENLDNIVTDSEAETARYLKDNLSYIKEVHVTKNLVKRQLTIQVTERKVLAYLNLLLVDDPKTDYSPKSNKKQKKKEHFYLIDQEGYVLESIKPEHYDKLTKITDEGEHIPEIGKQVKSTTTQLGIQVLKHVRLRKPEIAKDLMCIDARDAKKILIQLRNLPIQVWIAADMVEVGFHNLSLFINQHALSTLQNQGLLPVETQKRHQDADPRQRPSLSKYTYLDARYKDILYMGGANK